MLGTSNDSTTAPAETPAQSAQPLVTKETVVSAIFAVGGIVMDVFEEVPGMGILKAVWEKLESVYNDVQHSKELSRDLMGQARLLFKVLTTVPIEKLRTAFPLGAEVIENLVRRGYLEDFQALEQRLASSQRMLQTTLSLRQALVTEDVWTEFQNLRSGFATVLKRQKDENISEVEALRNAVANAPTDDQDEDLAKAVGIRIDNQVVLRDALQQMGADNPALDTVVVESLETGMIRQVLDPTEIQSKKTIIRGAFGQISRATWRGGTVAVKAGPEGILNNPLVLKQFIKELTVWSQLEHHNIISLYGAVLTEDPPSMVMPFADNGTVARYLQNYTGRDVMALKLYCLLQIAEGMNYIHEYGTGICHLDSKAANVVVDREGVMKIIDTGFSMMGKEAPITGHGVGSTRWCAPEWSQSKLMHDHDARRSVDVFAYGMTAFEILSGELSFQQIGSDLATLIEKCWSQNPAERPSFHMIWNILLGICTIVAPHKVKQHPVLSAAQLWHIFFQSSSRQTWRTIRTTSMNHSAPLGETRRDFWDAFTDEYGGDGAGITCIHFIQREPELGAGSVVWQPVYDAIARGAWKHAIDWAKEYEVPLLSEMEAASEGRTEFPWDQYAGKDLVALTSGDNLGGDESEEMKGVLRDALMGRIAFWFGSVTGEKSTAPSICNYQADLQWLVSAANRGNISGLYNAKYYLDVGRRTWAQKLELTDLGDAVRCYTILGNIDDVGTQTLLGDCHFCGYGVERNQTEDLEWYRRASQGDIGAEDSIDACTEGRLQPIQLAAWNGRAQIVKYLGGHMETVRILLEHRLAAVDDTRKDGSTSLHAASGAGHTDVANVLLQNGPSVNMVATIEATPLHLSASGGHTEIARALVEHGAAVDAKNRNGRTPLQFAAQNGHMDIAKALLDNRAEVLLDNTRADVNARKGNGWTPLHVAAEQCYVNVAKMLLDAGTEVDAKDYTGRKGSHVAADKNRVEVLALLKERVSKAELGSCVMM
ncbi:hypothetical protein HDV00_002691 [Rhizophlyctis rosea]|nr:hypothetical protein HDV00_002691 [Rhizophlyctis rosea]